MTTEQVRELAVAIRPLLTFIADAADLPKGILGLAMEPDGSNSCPIFAEFVDAITNTVKLGQRHAISSHDDMKVHYLIPKYHPLMVCITDSAEQNVLYLAKELARKTSAGPLSESNEIVSDSDIWYPLVKLFKREDLIPNQIKIYRHWLKRSTSLLYYIPREQKASISEWDRIVSSTHLSGYSIRTTILSFRLAQENDDVIESAQTLLNTLPRTLPHYEMKMLQMAERAKQYRRYDVDLEYHISVAQDKMILKVLCRGVEKRLVEVCPPKTSSTIDVGPKWVGMPAKTSAYRFLLFVLALRRGLSDHYKNRESKIVKWTLLDVLVPPQGQKRTLPEARGSAVNFEFMSVDRNAEKKAQRALKLRIDKRIKRTVSHVIKELDLPSEYVLISPSPDGYYITHPVHVDEAVVKFIQNGTKWGADFVQTVLDLDLSES